MNFKKMDDYTITEPVKMSKWKKIKRFVLWIVVLFLLFIVGLITIILVYQNDVKAAVVKELNKHLKAEVKIDPKNIDLTIIKTFPDCSIEFKDVLVLEALPIKRRDTLLFAHRLNLHFNTSDLWHKKYSIKKIKIRDGVLKPRILSDGKTNYIFWQADSTVKNDDNELNFNLALLTLDNFRMSFTNNQILFQTTLKFDHLKLRGDFKSDDYKLEAETEFLIYDITKERRKWLTDKKCSISVDLAVSHNNYNITKANISLNKIGLELGGRFIYNDSLSNLEISYNAPKLDISSLLSLLPTNYSDKISDYTSTGNFYANGKLVYQSEKEYSLESKFGINKGTITYKPQATTISEVDVEGNLEYGSKRSSLTLKNIYLKLNNDELKGSGYIKNFSDPYVRFSGSADLNLSNLKSFWPIDTLTTLKGNLKMRADIEGLLEDLKSKAFSTKVRSDVSASFKNIEMQFKNDEHLFAVESGSVVAANREVEITDIKFRRGKSDLLLNGRLPGFFNYLANDNAPLMITGNLVSNYIRLEDFMLKYNASGGKSDLIPANVTFKLDARINKFSYSGFNASAIKGGIDVKNQKAIVSDMTLETMNGEATIEAFADNSHNKLAVVLQSRLKNIDIKKLFFEFNNFGQSTLQEKNINGFASATIEFSGSWNNKLEVDYNSIRTSCDLNIERGELMDFKPLLSLSKFVDVQELQHIKFSTLQSNIEISNQQIRFPKTVLNNSALNIIFSGTHSFDNEIDYHIRLLISELLAKKRKKQNDEFGPVEEDKDNRRSAFILMTGTVDNPDIKYDRRGMKEKIKEDVKQEKQNVKSILKEEFGLFKKQNLPEKEKKTEQKFELEKPSNNAPKKTLERKKKPVEEDF